MKHVVQLSTAHSAYDVRIFHKECKSLARAGYRVTLIAQHSTDAQVGQVRIRGLRTPRGRWDRMCRLVYTALRMAQQENAAVYHFHDPELLPAGVLLKVMGRKVFYDVHEDLPKQILEKDWVPPRIRSVLASVMNALEQGAARILDGVVVATPAIGRRFPPERTAIVQNFPLVDELAITDGAPYQERQPMAAYIGGIQSVRGAREMVKALAELGHDSPIRLEMAGEIYPASLEDELTSMPGWKHVVYRGMINRSEVRGLLARARIGLVLFHPLPNHVEAQPNKLFEYMSAGIPVVASDFPLWREIVGEADCGLLVDPCDPKAIARAISWLIEHGSEAERMGRAGQIAVRKRFNWEEESEQLLEFYRRRVG